MSKYSAYDSRLIKTAAVKENGTMGRHTSASPPPVLGDGKRRPIRDRLQNITSAMSWIKEELVSELAKIILFENGGNVQLYCETKVCMKHDSVRLC